MFALFRKFKKVQLSVQLVKRTAFLKDVFQSGYQKRVLISYLTSPFKKGLSDSHTSTKECYTAALVFHELGFCVDVVDLDDENRVTNFGCYDAIYGFGTPYEKSFGDPNFKGKRILYSTGCNSNYTNLSTTARLRDFYIKTNKISPQLIRTVGQSWPLQKYLSDAIITLGNKFVGDTYRRDNISNPIYEINLFYAESKTQTVIEKDYSKIKNNLIWFGSQSSVHKGLDIALDMLQLFPEITLYVCGYQKANEPEVYEYYKTLFESGRAVDCGFLNIHSNAFIALLDNVGGVLFPSAAEGGAAALLTLMGNAGIVPITTKSTGLDIEQYGFIADEVNTESVKLQVEKYLNTSPNMLTALSEKLRQEIRIKHSYESYKTRLYKVIQSTLA